PRSKSGHRRSNSTPFLTLNDATWNSDRNEPCCGWLVRIPAESALNRGVGTGEFIPACGLNDSNHLDQCLLGPVGALLQLNGPLGGVPSLCLRRLNCSPGEKVGDERS